LSFIVILFVIPIASRDATSAVGKLMAADIKKECIHLSANPCFKPKLSKVSENVIARDIIAAIAAVYIIL